jgi:hypothetical protein
MTKNPEAPEATLTSQQTTALPLLAAGAKKRDAAAAAGVCPQTISAWLQEPHFSAVLKTKREQLAGLAVERLKEATDRAVATVIELMESGGEPSRLKAAIYLLDRVLLLAAGETAPASDRPDSREVLLALGVNG